MSCHPELRPGGLGAVLPAGHTQLFQQRQLYRGIACRPRGDQAGQRQPGPADDLVDLRAQSVP